MKNGMPKAARIVTYVALAIAAVSLSYLGATRAVMFDRQINTYNREQAAFEAKHGVPRVVHMEETRIIADEALRRVAELERRLAAILEGKNR